MQQQNAIAERKHRHIIEVGLSLLAQASMPLKFWDEAFLTVVHLINMLPSRIISFENPLERISGALPNYSSLRVFGCARWPNLRPYASRKLEFRSKQCVFLGYTDAHKGYKCLDISTGRVYLSVTLFLMKEFFRSPNYTPMLVLSFVNKYLSFLLRCILWMVVMIF